MQHVWKIVLGVLLGAVMVGTAVANPPGEAKPDPNPALQEYTRRVDLALRPLFSPLVTKWIQQKYGKDATARIRFIAVEPNGVLHVHVDAEAPGKTCIFALFYEWRDGWRIDQVDNHSGSASGCH